MMKENWIVRLRVMAGIAAALLVALSGAPIQAQEQVVPVVDGHLGRCTADFTVTDKDGNPIYDAKIDVSIRYGFLGMRRMSLQVGTNGEGRARVAGLPDKPDKKFSFKITSGSLSDAVLMNTSDGCKAGFEVVLEE
ncbi:MAG: hypothetical protein JW793_11050 [Acidobacteria bacterium]|nr:hypothetical protein [Acidobacteriota bacterium]